MSVGKRFISRFNPGKPAWLEEIIQPLYHRITVATVPIEQRFFSAIGSTSPLDITPQLSASNGQIPDPKIFVIHGIRLVPEQKTGAIGTPADMTARIADALTLRWDFFYQLFIGERFYLHAPSFLLPSGGLGERFSRDQGGIVGAVDTAAAWSGGGYFDRFSLLRVPITVPSRQLFYGIHNLGVPGNTLTAETRVWNVLDGAFGREL